MNTDFHHVYSKGEMVIFRDADDYTYFQNRLAIDKYGKNIKILAFSVMSTHIHIIVETWDEDDLKEFISEVKWAYAIHFKHKYKRSLPKEFLQIEYLDKKEEIDSKKNQVIYVNKNPLHHQVCGSVFAYEYSSARYTFMEQVLGERISKLYLDRLKKVSELSVRELRKIIGHKEISKDTLVDIDLGVISPLSIIDIPKVRAYWGRAVRQFILNLHYKAKDSAGEYIEEDVLCFQTDKFSDIDVCKIIDDFAKERGVESFAFLNEEHRKHLIKILYGKFVSKAQIERCLWVKL